MTTFNDKVYKMASHNTKYNSDGNAIIEKNDEWRNEMNGTLFMKS